MYHKERKGYVQTGDGVRVFRRSTTPDSTNGVRVGDLWIDTTSIPCVYKKLISESPIVWSSIEAPAATIDAPVDAPYLTTALNATLTNERVLTAGSNIHLEETSNALTVSVPNLSGTNTGDQTITLTGDMTGSGSGAISTTLATSNGSPGTYGSSSQIPSITVNSKGLVTNVTTNSISTGLVPSGTITMYGALTPPTGWLLCQGQVVSRTTYAGLFSIIGTTYGAGDGSTTFSLPNLTQRFPLGKATTGTGSTLGSTGGTIDHTHNVTTGSVAVGIVSLLGTGAPPNTTYTSTPANPPYISLMFIIKI